MEYKLPYEVSKHLKATGEDPEEFLNRAASAAVREDQTKGLGNELPYYAVTNVFATANYLLLLTFANGDRRLFDADILRGNPFYRELLSGSGFTCAKVDGRTVVWEDKHGIFDELPPRYLYDNSVSIDNLKAAVKEATALSAVKRSADFCDKRLSEQSSVDALDKVYLPAEFVKFCNNT